MSLIPPVVWEGSDTARALEKKCAHIMRAHFTEHDYQMVVNGAQVAIVHRKWLTI